MRWTPSLGKAVRKRGDEGIRAVLNAGYERKAVVPRCVGPQFELKDFRVFCPKVMAGIDRCLPDTVADRSITIVMERQKPGQSERFRAREANLLAHPIAKALENWSTRLSIQTKLAEARPDIPGELGDRAADICEPLLAIADMAGGKWPEVARSAIVTLFSESEADDDNTGIQLLKAIREIFDKHGDDRISTPYMLGELIGRDNGEPWGAWWSRDIKNENIQGPSARLARLLKPFKIKPETLRWQDGSIAKGYKLEAFKDAFSRYILSFTS